MKRISLFLSCLVIFPALTFAKAQLGVGGGVGTLGASASAVVQLGQHFSLEGSYNDFTFYQPDSKSSIGGTDMLIKPRLRTLLAAANFYPVQNGIFHLTAGFADNMTEADVNVDTPATGTFNVTGISGAQKMSDFGGKITGTAKADPVSPYIGVGLGGNPSRIDSKKSHLFFDANIGVLYHGKPTVTFKANKAVNADGQKVLNQLKTNFEDDAKQHEFYPVVMVNLYYFI